MTLLLVSVLLPAAQAHAARGLDLGLTDATFESSSASTRMAWLGRAVQARADNVLLGATWAAIASRRPANPANPRDPAYAWGSLDAAVRDAEAHGLGVTLLVNQAPRWAEGGHRPGLKRAPAGTWKPQPKALRQFGAAIARRYSGSFGGLPRVRRFQLWAEPNLSINLAPQWKGSRPVGPEHYRAMLNAFYRGIHSVRGDQVLTGGTAPYGDFGHKQRMQPAIFWRALLRRPAHFDIAAHNPINVRAPTRHALNRNDISTPDIGKLRRIIRRGHALPHGRKPIWATEIWWDSRPPDPHGVPAGRQARWLEQAFYVLWKQGVRSVTWFLIRDQAAHGNYAGTFQTGLFLRSGKPKPAFRAFSFPFVAGSRHGHRVQVWGKAPRTGVVQVQRKRGHGWRTVKRLHAGNNRVFVGRVHVGGSAKLRARSGGKTSLVWRVR